MASIFTAKLEGLKHLLENMETYSKRKTKDLTNQVVVSTATIAQNAKHRVPKDLRNLEKSIQHVVKIRQDKIIGEVFTNSEYAAPTEFGARPHWTKKENLQGWADRKHIPVGAVQWSIATKGTRPQPFLDPAYRGEKPRFLNAVRRIMQAP